MAALELQSKAQPETDQEIRNVIVSHVYNNARIDFSGDRDGSRYEAYKRVFREYCSGGFPDKDIALLWMDWGTREGFTII